MKGFILDSTYKDTTIIDSNDDISIIASHNLPKNTLNHHPFCINGIKLNYISHDTKNDRFNSYNVIDYL